MYDDVTDIVDNIKAYYDNTETSTLQNSTARNARILHYVQRSVEDLWYDPHTWPFTMKVSGSLTMSGGSVALPTDFARVSMEGGVYDINGRPWTEINYQDMLYMRTRHLEQSARFYATDGVNLLIPNTSSAEKYRIIYQMVSPTVTYNTGTDPTGFPLVFGEALLLGAVTKLKEEEGDARQIWRQDYAKAVARAATVWTKRSRPTRMPVTVGGMW